MKLKFSDSRIHTLKKKYERKRFRINVTEKLIKDVLHFSENPMHRLITYY